MADRDHPWPKPLRNPGLRADESDEVVSPTTGVKTGDLFYRTDLKMEFVWDGTRWLSTELFTRPIDMGGTAASSLPTACAKCHATDLSVRWDETFYDCTWKQQERRDWARGGGEHLHHQCRTCGYSWAVDTLEESS